MQEMTEASERIYTEVGEDADIIWGTVVDESLGDEIRVTVIATGIEEPGAVSAERRKKTANFRQEKAARETSVTREIRQAPRQPMREMSYKDKDINSTVDYEEPAFMRKKKSKSESDEAEHSGTQIYDGKTIDPDDLDIPTFLRRKAG